MWGNKSDQVQQWITDLKKKNPDFRRQAVEELGKIRDPRSVAPLIHILVHDEVSVRWEAAEALGKIGDLQAVEPLIHALQDPDWTVRKNAAWALGNIRDIRAVEPLIQALTDQDADVRKEAVSALGAIDDPRAVEALIQRLEDEMFTVRLNAVKVLGNMGALCTIEALTMMLNDSSPLIQAAAARALQNIVTAVETVMFGHPRGTLLNLDTTLFDPDVATLTVPMVSLERVVIDSETYSFHQVERFLTYAVNAIGQTHLKEHVGVHIYGDAEQVHPNLLNSFNNLCKQVEVHRTEHGMIGVSGTP
jgi:hypothetical protein